MNKINVEYNNSSSRLEFSCPPYMNGVIKSMPNRRWNSKSKKWTAPLIKPNVEYIIRKMYNTSIIVFSTEASAAVDAAVDKYNNKSTNKTSFPPGYIFKTKPRAKQQEALNKLYGMDSMALFMDMRTGKTKVVIDMICAMRMQGKADKVLIICPLSVRKNWVREINIHSPLNIDTHLLDTSKPKLFDKWLSDPHDNKWMIVGVESLSAGSAFSYCQRFLLTGMRVVSVIDESHNIKNPSSTRTTRCISIGRMSETRIIMTGTPLGKNPLDLYAQFEFLNPDIIGLGNYYAFCNRYAIMGGFENKQVIGYSNLDELTELIEPYVFQVRKKDAFPDAPLKVYEVRTVELTPNQKKFYKSIKKEKMVEYEGNKLIVQNVLEKMLRLQEITGGIISFENSDEQKELTGEKFHRELIPGGNPKLMELMNCLEEYDGPTIIWCAYKEEIFLVADAIRKVYGDDQVVEVHGDISEDQRDINVNSLFQTGKAKYLVGNTATGGVGLTITTAEVEIYYSNTFKYIDREQSEERAFHQDKPNGTMIIDIIASGTIDAHVIKSLEEKKNIAEFIRDSIDELKDKIYGDI